MSYVFETENKNYEDFASGRVLYNQCGATSFPVRLASEIFLRCEQALRKAGRNGPYSIYDPCCGGAYLLTVIGFLHGGRISEILASDISGDMVALARRNLALLALPGMEERIGQLRKMIADFGKVSHRDALQSAAKLRESLVARKTQVDVISFVADATREQCINKKIDMVITDLPYGNIVQWSDAKDDGSAVRGVLDSLIPVLAGHSIAAVVSGKKTALKHEQYKRVDQFQIGKRKVTFLQLIVKKEIT